MEGSCSKTNYLSHELMSLCHPGSIRNCYKSTFVSRTINFIENVTVQPSKTIMHYSKSGGSVPVAAAVLLVVVHRAARLPLPGLARRPRRPPDHQRRRRGRRHRLRRPQALPPGGPAQEGCGRGAGQEGQGLREQARQRQSGQGKLIKSALRNLWVVLTTFRTQND